MEKPGIATWLSHYSFDFSAIFFHVDSCESYATLDTDERQKSGDMILNLCVYANYLFANLLYRNNSS